MTDMSENLEVEIANLEEWLMQSNLSIHNATMLILGRSPLERMANLNKKDKDTYKIMSMAIVRGMENEEIDGHLDVGTCGNIPVVGGGVANSQKSFVNVASLKDFLRKYGYIDNPFMAEETKTLDGPDPDKKPKKKYKRGRKPTFKWKDFYIELARVIAERGGVLPDFQKELEEEMHTWCEDNWGTYPKGPPGDSTVREKIVQYISKL